jgi:hypothetical protein
MRRKLMTVGDLKSLLNEFEDDVEIKVEEEGWVRCLYKDIIDVETDSLYEGDGVVAVILTD